MRTEYKLNGFVPNKELLGESTYNLQVLYEEAVRLAEEGKPVGYTGHSLKPPRMK